jgi:hypothetical protein
VAIDSRIILDTTPATPRSRTTAPSAEVAWRWIGWFALLLTVTAIGDWTLAWLPFRFGSPEWEFGTIAATFSGLPLLTMGFAGLLGSAISRGIRWQVIVTSWLMILFALMILSALVIFLLDVPIALRAVSGPARLGIFKAIAKTGLIGLLFPTGFLVAAVGALRYLAKHSQSR